MSFQIARATRRKAKARIGLTGPSGSGKTYSSLLLAKGMAEGMGFTGENAIGVIDTERGSAELYADLVPFVVLNLTPPYSPDRYREAITALEKHGCQIIILDQISHAWAGEGGLLERVDTWKAGSKNKVAPWAQATPEQNKFVDALLHSPAHIISTMRVKTEWVIEPGEKPKKVGLAPVQRGDIEYEFTVMLDLEKQGNYATESKDRTGLFKDRRFIVNEEVGHALAKWLNEGGPERFEATERAQLQRKLEEQRPAAERMVSAERKAERARQEDPASNGFGDHDGPPDQGQLVSDGQVRSFWARLRPRAKEVGVDAETAAREILGRFGLASSKAIPAAQFDAVLEAIRTFSGIQVGCPECKSTPCAASCSLQGAQPPAASEI